MKDKIDTSSMSWRDVTNISRFTKNDLDNKGQRAKKVPSILLGAIQLVGNYLKGIKQLNAYESSSIIKSDSTWLQKHSFTEFRNEEKKKVNIEIGQVCYLDYGKTFRGELSYCHYGLCVAKKEGKLLFIPMTSGTTWITDCYHPTQNPYKSKRYRIALKSEGFSKDCVLIMNDCKFLSAGRIEDLDVKITNYEVLSSIQQQLFSVCFPSLKKSYDKMAKQIKEFKLKINNKNETISALKEQNEVLTNELSSLTNSKAIS